MEQTKQCPKCNHHNHKLYYTLSQGKERGHCKHCGYGYTKNITGGYAKLHTNKTYNSFKLPNGFSSNWNDWIPEAVEWVHKYNISPTECIKYKIGMGTYCDRLTTTVWDSEGLASMQHRALFPDQAPKYLTKKNRVYPFHIDNGDVCVLTEDVLSAIKAGRYYSSMALQGTTLSDVYLSKLLKYKLVLICLDNDNAIVRRQQRKIKKTLDMLVDNRLLLLDRDVKELTDKQIQELV